MNILPTYHNWIVKWQRNSFFVFVSTARARVRVRNMANSGPIMASVGMKRRMTMPSTRKLKWSANCSSSQRSLPNSGYVFLLTHTLTVLCLYVYSVLYLYSQSPWSPIGTLLTYWSWSITREVLTLLFTLQFKEDDIRWKTHENTDIVILLEFHHFKSSTSISSISWFWFTSIW
jgi:hypothetical protein